MGDMQDLKETLGKLADELLPSLGLELVDLELEISQHRRILRFFVDRPEGGVTVDECAHASRKLSAAMEESSPVEGAHIMEVSSPGLDRRVARPRDYKRFAGRRAKVRLKQGIEGRKNFDGVIEEAGEEGFTLVFGTERLALRYSNVARTNLVYEAGNTEEPHGS
jgi:ribosome maturation factor RimP